MNLKPLKTTLAVMVVVAATGCASNKEKVAYPMHTSLDWLTAEAGPTRKRNNIPQHLGAKLYRGFWETVKLGGAEFYYTNSWWQRSIVSVSGQLPMVNVGEAYYWEEDASPTTALHIHSPAGGTKWLEGTVKPQKTHDIYTALTDLEGLQDMTAKSITLGMEEARLVAANDVSGRLKEIRDDLKTTIGEVERLGQKVKKALTKKGVIVFRWTKQLESSYGATAGEYGSGSKRRKDTETGFGIINGIRIKSLRNETFTKSDYDQARNKLGVRDVGQLGVVTYLLQGKSVFYVREMELLRSFSAEVNISRLIKDFSGGSISPDSLSKLQLALNIYRSTMTSLSTLGAIDGLTWTETPDISASANSWATVYAVVTHPKGVISTVKP